MQKQLKIILTSLLVSWLCGCATGPDVQTKLVTPGATFDQTFTPPPGKGLVFIHRDGQMLGAAVLQAIYFDGVPLGNLRGDSFFAVEALPGNHIMTMRHGEGKPQLQTIEVTSGEVQVWRLKVSNRPWTRFSGEEARNLIKESHFRGSFDPVGLKQLKRGINRNDVHRMLLGKSSLNPDDTYTGMERFYTMRFRYENGNLREWGFLRRDTKIYAFRMKYIYTFVKTPEDANVDLD